MSFYMSPDKFNNLYVIKSDISVQKKSRVYSTTKSCAVKESSIDWSINDVCYSLQFNHPNIIKILNYTFVEKENDIYIKYVMPLGQSYEEIYKNPNELPILIHDITSALKYLKDQGYVYADLKPENIVRFPSTATERAKYVLIDLGFIRPFMNLSDGQVFAGIAYTLGFRDYQFYDNYNYISCEIYSLGQTLRCILTNKTSIYLSTVNKDEISKGISKNFPEIPNSHKNKYFILISGMIMSPTKRISYEEILDHDLLSEVETLTLKIKNNINFAKYKSPTFNDLSQKIDNKLWSRIRYWFCFDEPLSFDLDMRGMFIALHNIKKCLDFCDESDIQTCIAVNGYLTSTLLHSSKKEYNEMLEILEDSFNAQNFIPMMVKVIDFLGENFIPFTGWNISSTYEELLSNFTKALELETFFGKHIINRIIQPQYKKKVTNLYINYQDFFHNLDLPLCLDKDRENLINEKINNKSLSLKNNELPLIKSPKENFEYLAKNKTFDPNFVELFDPKYDVGILIYIDEYLAKNKQLGNYFIFLLKNVDSRHLDRYSYFLDIPRLKTVFQNSHPTTNLYFECRNLEN